jgi:hypothetical protein
MQDQVSPTFVEPMLLAACRELPSGESWWAELKLDGARGQLRVTGGVAELRTRHGRRCDDEFPNSLPLQRLCRTWSSTGKSSSSTTTAIPTSLIFALDWAPGESTLVRLRSGVRPCLSPSTSCGVEVWT